MKTKKTTWPGVLPLLAGTLTLSSVHAQQTSTTEWAPDPETPGNWQDAGSWSAGVPVVDSLAGILNGGTVNVTSPTAVLEQLHVLGNGGTSGFGTLTQSGGDLIHTAGNFRVGPNNTVGQFDISNETAVVNNPRLNLGGKIANQNQ